MQHLVTIGYRGDAAYNANMPTIRVDEKVREAIESYRDEGQSVGEAVKQMADELGLFGSRRVEEFRETLSGEYGFTDEQVAEIEDALRILYTRQVEPTNEVPSEAVSDIQDEVGILERLDLISETSGSYSLKNAGEVVAPIVTEQYLEQRAELFDDLLTTRHELLLAFLLEFGFHKTMSGHLSSTPSPLSTNSEKAWWSENETIDREYDSLKRQLLESGVAVESTGPHVGSRVDLPPEFESVLAAHTDELRAALERMECYRIIFDVANDKKEKTRERMMDTLQVASEKKLKEAVNELHDDGIVSQYTNNETPFLVKDTAGLLAHIEQELSEVENGL